MVFQKKVCLGTLLDPGGGGLPNPTESTMWGKGSSGAYPLRNAWIPRRGAAAPELLGPTGPDGVNLRPTRSVLVPNLFLSRGGGPPGDATCYLW